MTPPTYGLYIHVPFCARICRYCDFHSITAHEPDIAPLLAAIAEEHHLLRTSEGLTGAQPGTIYFGGGTPSIIPAALFELFVAALFKEIDRIPGCETTIECNPDSFSSVKADSWKRCGCNRLSLGVQSFSDRELALCGRPHTAADARSVLADPALNGFDGISVDLIKGLPGQTAASLRSSIEQALAFPHVNHISLYDLTIADKTPFGRHRATLPLPGEEEIEVLSNSAAELLTNAGFTRYEVSNWARNSGESRHNSAYWDHTPYLGLGPSAHSFVNTKRWSNTTDHASYMTHIHSGKSAATSIETVDPTAIGDEMIALGMRTRRGINFAEYQSAAGKPFLTDERKSAIEMIAKAGFVEIDKEVLRPTDAGLDRADGIARMLA